MVQTFDDINARITDNASQAISNFNSYINNEMNQSFAYINLTASNIGSQLLTIFNSTNCTKVFPCANSTYVSLTNLVTQTYQNLVNCIAPISTYMQTNATQIITEYTAAKNGLVAAVTLCSPHPLTFDSCLTVSKS